MIERIVTSRMNNVIDNKNYSFTMSSKVCCKIQSDWKTVTSYMIKYNF